MTRRMGLALLALVGLFVAGYLALYKLHIIGTLVCTAEHSCERVQNSKYARFGGIPVALWGVAYYALLFALTLAGTMDRWVDSRRFAAIVAVLTGWGVLFSARLTYLEGFVIHAWCWWCVGSASIVTVLFVLAVIDWRATPAFDDDVSDDIVA